MAAPSRNTIVLLSAKLKNINGVNPNRLLSLISTWETQLSLPARIYTCESLSRNLLSNDIGDVTSPAWWKKVAAMPIIGATWRIRYSICRYQYRPVIDHFVLLLQVPPPSEAADLERSVDATMHVRPSFPPSPSFFSSAPPSFSPGFCLLLIDKSFRRRKRGRRKIW